MKKTSLIMLAMIISVSILSWGNTDMKQNNRSSAVEGIKNNGTGIDPNIVNVFFEVVDNQPELDVENCEFFTRNFKLAYIEFCENFEVDHYPNEYMDSDPMWANRDNPEKLEVKEIRGNYVLYKNKNGDVGLSARLINVNGQTLIDGIGLINMPFIKGSLKKELWKNVQPCYRHLDDENMIDIIDDSRNGYLNVSGGIPGCGCECDISVAAYKDSFGFYTILAQDNASCDQRNKIASNRLLSEVFPEGFGLQTFILELNSLEKNEFAQFSLKLEIPRYGTDTEVKIERIPIGLNIKGRGSLIYFYSSEFFREFMNDASELVKRFLGDDKNIALVNKLFDTKISDLNDDEKNLLTKFFVRTNDEMSKINSLDDLQAYFDKIKTNYNYYLKVKYRGFLLGWDKNKARFYIKEKYEDKDKMTFEEYLFSAVFASIDC